VAINSLFAALFAKYLTTTEYSIDPARSHPSAARDANERV